MNLSDGVCHLCRFEIEDIKHLFLTCPTTQASIGVLENKMNEILANHGFSNIVLEGYHVILGFLHDNKTLRIFVNFILHIFKWELWKTRNKIKYENQSYTVVNITVNTVRKILEATSFIDKTNISKHYKNVISLLNVWNSIE